MTNKKIIEIERVLLNHAEEPDDFKDVDTFTTYRASMFVFDLYALFLQDRKEIYKKIEGEIKQLKSNWDKEPPKPGTEDHNDPAEMYKCGYFDALAEFKQKIDTLLRELAE